MTAQPDSAGVELFYAPSEALFAAAAPAMAARGWSVFPQTVEDRRPGSVFGEMIRWARDHDLANRRPSAETLDLWCRHCGTLNVAAVLGPASGNAFAIDIDVLDDRMCAEVEDIATEVLGPTPLRRLGRSPKTALIYRHAEGDRIASVSRIFALPEGADGEATNFGLEILASGKVITFHGRHHKTGRYFKWLEASPLLVGPEAAPLVTSAQVKDFLAAVGARHPFAGAAPGSALRVERANAVGGARLLKGSGEWLVGEDGLISQGREAYLFHLALETARSNRDRILAAGSDNAVHLLCRGFAATVAQEFEATARCDGRWEPENLRREALSRVTRLVAKLRSGAWGLAGPSRRARPVSGLSTQTASDEEQGGQADGRPTIRLAVGEISATVDAVETALIDARRGLYQRGGEIVRLGEVRVKTARGEETSAQRIFEVGDYALLEHVSASASFTRFDARKGEDRRCDPPMALAKTLRERRGRLRLPVLSGVISAPTLRPNGSLLSVPGYDEATGLLFDPAGVTFPQVAEEPTKEQAEAALAKRRDLIGTFPFVGPADRAVALSAMLTAVVRRSLPTAPMHAFSAPTAGTGKSTLVDIAAILATGRRAGVIAQGHTDEELEKRLGTELLQGSAVLAIDNVARPLDSDLLCQVLTQHAAKPRILGRSEAPEVPTSALVAATGNNLVLVGDLTRRTLLCRLDAGVERPELREFRFDVLEEVERRRASYVAAALTVIRAALAARIAQQRPPLGSFGDWSAWVREALLWLGEADPVETIEEARALDPKLDALTTVLSQWQEVIGTRKVSARDVIAAATEAVPGDGQRYQFRHANLREALLCVAGDGGSISTRRLGRWLTASMGRRVGGLQITRAGVLNGIQQWRLDGEVSGASSGRSDGDVPEEQAAVPVTGPAPELQRIRDQLASIALQRTGNAEAAKAWLNSHHESFGASPLEYCTSAEALGVCMEVLEIETRARAG